MKLFIHIGSDKCGSTAIQTSLFINREEIIQQGIYLPKSGLGTNSGHAKCFQDESGETFLALISELKSVEHAFKFAVISWEGIHFLKPEKMQSHFYRLKTFESVAIYYIRDQAELIQTGILQQWKTSNCGLPFAPRVPNTRLFFNIAEQWTKFLGQKTLLAHYDRKTFHGGDITLDFYAKIGLKNIQRIFLLKNDVNESLAFESGFLLAMLDRTFAPPLPRRRLLVDALLAAQTQFSLTKYFFTQSEVEFVRAYYRENNRLLESKYGLTSFNANSPCWRLSTEKFSLHADLLAKTLELFDIPVLGSNNRTDSPLQEMTKTGWFNVENWGAWAQGNISVLRFRISANDIIHRYALQQDILINIKGRYFTSIENKSVISINGSTPIKVNLSDYTFSIPINEIPQDRCFELTIENHNQASPLALGIGNDNRMLSFGIEKIRLK